MKTIPIFFTFDRYYVLAACVAFYSLLRHASTNYQYHLYVVHTDLENKHQCRIRKIVSQFKNARIDFIDASAYHTGWEKLQVKSHFSKEIFYKLTAADMFPTYDRILFSDVDVIFTDDISPSYFLFPEEDFYYAGTRPIQENTSIPRYRANFTPEEIDIVARYEISAGYMLLNLKCLRRDNKQAELTQFFRSNAHRLLLPEQDCIALCCTQGIRFMDHKYVVCGFQFHVPDEQVIFNPYGPYAGNREKELELWHRMQREVVQVHYAGLNKPWNSPFVDEYRKWLATCSEAGLIGYYLRLQPLFILQRLRRYSLKRFIRKLKQKL